MTAYRHTCGAQVDSRLEHHGFDYRIEFIAPVSRAQLMRCPGCGAGLAAALRNGQLTENTAQCRTKQG